MLFKLCLIGQVELPWKCSRNQPFCEDEDLCLLSALKEYHSRWVHTMNVVKEWNSKMFVFRFQSSMILGASSLSIWTNLTMPNHQRWWNCSMFSRYLIDFEMCKFANKWIIGVLSMAFVRISTYICCISINGPILNFYSRNECLYTLITVLINCLTISSLHWLEEKLRFAFFLWSRP